jgi:glycosyltransferase involved in cell wall biosynthesis
MARSLIAAGHRVIVASGDREPRALTELEADGALSYVGLAELPTSDQGLLGKMRRVFFDQGERTIRWLQAQETRPTHVIAYGCYSPFIGRLRAWCERTATPLVADIVEWYDGSHQAGGRLGPFHLSTEHALRRHFHRCAGVIAISRYLEDHYRARGTKVIRVPPTLDVLNAPLGASDRRGGPLRLVYAGTPGKKDLLANIIRGVALVDPSGKAVELEVLGPGEADVARLLGGTVPPAVRVRGRVSQAAVAESVGSADFSVLLRRPLRFAQAGFPTKVAESLAVGTPVISNATSDIAEYARDGAEGIICASESPDAFAQGLKRALSLTDVQRVDMRKAARTRAERCFDFRSYSTPLNAFIEELGR